MEFTPLSHAGAAVAGVHAQLVASNLIREIKC